MTATPIPRTLAMTAYADLDVSIIDELPPGRTAVKTVVLTDARRDEVVVRIRTACMEGRQAYWVCPLIDESEEMPYQAAEETAAALAAALPELAVGLVHGRMPSAAGSMQVPACCCTAPPCRRWRAIGWPSCATPMMVSWWRAATSSCAVPAN
jgi:RecG-like helicase